MVIVAISWGFVFRSGCYGVCKARDFAEKMRVRGLGFDFWDLRLGLRLFGYQVHEGLGFWFEIVFWFPL